MPTEAPAPAAVPDLMAALEASLAAVKGPAPASEGNGGTKPGKPARGGAAKGKRTAKAAAEVEGDGADRDDAPPKPKATRPRSKAK